MTEEELIRKIRKLYGEKKPLNISAVNRHYPELLEAAFSLSPFLGWRGAMDKAGIDYSDILIELSDSVECQICGQHKRSIANHARMLHGYTQEDYIKEFPEADLICDESRAKSSRFDNHWILPHWEPFWTPEYILDRIFAFHKIGYPLTGSVMSKVDGGLGNAIADWKDSLGSWEEIVRDFLELEPDDGRSQGLKMPAQKDALSPASRYTDADSVIAKIQFRVRQKLPVSATRVQKGPDNDPPLHVAALRFFGDWETAVRKTGVNPKLLFAPKGPSRKYPDRDSVIKAIKLRANQKLPINHLNVAKGENSDTALLFCAIEYFDSWDQALEHAGFNPEKNRSWQVRGYTTEEKVTTAIWERFECEEAMNAGGICHGPHPNNSLYNAGIRFFNSWPNALRAAGIAPQSIVLTPAFKARKERFPNPTSVVREIHKRKKENKTLLKSRLVVGPNAGGDPMLLRFGGEYFGSWDAALEAAGIEPNSLRAVPLRNLTPEKVIVEIKKREQFGLPLNPGGVKYGEHVDTLLYVAALLSNGAFLCIGWNRQLYRSK